MVACQRLVLLAALVTLVVLARLFALEDRSARRAGPALRVSGAPTSLRALCCRAAVVGNGTLAKFVDAGALTLVGSHRSNAPLLQRCCNNSVERGDVAPTPEPLLRPVTRVQVDFVTRTAPCLASPPVNMTACVIVRNRVKLTVEWIQWHRLLGVRHFHVYDDSSTDGLAAALAPFVDAGVVELHDAPQPPYSFRGMPKTGPQFSAYDDCLTRAAPGREWVALFDNDEFPALTKHACLTDYVVDAVAARRRGDGRLVGAVALPWADVGHRNEMRDAARSQLEMTGFSMGVMDPHQHIKSIVRSHLVTTMETPHQADLADNAITIFATGDEVAGKHLHTRPSAKAVDLGRLLHFQTRSFASFLQRHDDGRSDLRTRAAKAVLDVGAAFRTWEAAAGAAVPETWKPSCPVRWTHAVLITAMGLEQWPMPTATIPSMANSTENRTDTEAFRWITCCH
jgi:hypothetical protein